ncbi:MAG: hypothetical protein FWC98_04955, partial [Bacteroidales bacterium]|nr:hypothetical protein [Bacteroidales bacterium]
MRKFFFFSAICLMINIVFAAPPQAINFQAVVRDDQGYTHGNTNIRAIVTIWENWAPGGVSGVAVYTEEHIVRSNMQGMINFAIGQGTSSDQFGNINWGEGTHHVQLQIDIGNTGFSTMGIDLNMQPVKLFSVPYALFTEHARFADTAEYARNAGGG